MYIQSDLPKRFTVRSEYFFAFNTSRSAPMNIKTKVRHTTVNITVIVPSLSFCLLFNVGFPMKTASFSLSLTSFWEIRYQSLVICGHITIFNADSWLFNLKICQLIFDFLNDILFWSGRKKGMCIAALNTKDFDWCLHDKCSNKVKLT